MTTTCTKVWLLVSKTKSVSQTKWSLAISEMALRCLDVHVMTHKFLFLLFYFVNEHHIYRPVTVWWKFLNFTLFRCFCMPSETFKPESIFKQTRVNIFYRENMNSRVNIFYRENMTSFLNYVTSMLKALSTGHGSTFQIWHFFLRCLLNNKIIITTL